MAPPRLTLPKKKRRPKPEPGRALAVEARNATISEQVSAFGNKPTPKDWPYGSQPGTLQYSRATQKYGEEMFNLDQISGRQSPHMVKKFQLQNFRRDFGHLLPGAKPKGGAPLPGAGMSAIESPGTTFVNEGGIWKSVPSVARLRGEGVASRQPFIGPGQAVGPKGSEYIERVDEQGRTIHQMRGPAQAAGAAEPPVAGSQVEGEGVRPQEDDKARMRLMGVPMGEGYKPMYDPTHKVPKLIRSATTMHEKTLVLARLEDAARQKGQDLSVSKDYMKLKEEVYGAQVEQRKATGYRDFIEGLVKAPAAEVLTGFNQMMLEDPERLRKSPHYRALATTALTELTAQHKLATDKDKKSRLAAEARELKAGIATATARQGFDATLTGGRGTLDKVKGEYAVIPPAVPDWAFQEQWAATGRTVEQAINTVWAGDTTTGGTENPGLRHVLREARKGLTEAGILGDKQWKALAEMMWSEKMTPSFRHVVSLKGPKELREAMKAYEKAHPMPAPEGLGPSKAAKPLPEADKEAVREYGERQDAKQQEADYRPGSANPYPPQTAAPAGQKQRQWGPDDFLKAR